MLFSCQRLRPLWKAHTHPLLLYGIFVASMNATIKFKFDGVSPHCKAVHSTRTTITAKRDAFCFDFYFAARSGRARMFFIIQGHQIQRQEETMRDTQTKCTFAPNIVLLGGQLKTRFKNHVVLSTSLALFAALCWCFHLWLLASRF